MNDWLDVIVTSNRDDSDYNDTGLYSYNDTDADDYWDPYHPPNTYRPSRAVFGAVSIYMTFVFVFAFSLNSLVLYTAYKNRILRTPLNYIILNMTTSDLLMTITSSFVCIFSNIAGGFFLGKWMCTWHGLLTSIAGVSSLLSISVMAFERYFVICKPFGPVRLTEKHATFGIAFTWIYSTIWHLIPYFLWDDGYAAEGFGTTCAPNYFVTEPEKRLFITLYFVFCFILPYSVTGISYGRLIATLRQMKKESMVSSSSNVSADAEVTKMVVVMVTAFVIAWTPYAVVCMITVYSTDKSVLLPAIPAFFAKLGAVYNPIVYIGLNRQFRDCVIKVLFKGKNPWSDEPMATSSMASQMSTVSSNRVGPA